jgi:hypothetical protein
MVAMSHASKFSNWEKQYNWDTCKTNRKEFGLFITDFLISDSRVINLNGVYGSGKTEFIRRIYVELARRQHPVVYIDVWESDFSNNPLAVICSELFQQIELILKKRTPNTKTTDMLKAKKTLNIIKQKFGLCLKYAEAGALFTGDPTVVAGTKTLSTLVNTTSDINTKANSQKLIETVQRNHVAAVQAIKDIKENITFLSGLIEVVYELNTPIVILIDELDRCRPSHAVEVLESIKHFFETKGCTFLVATNTEVLEHSVRSIYGQTFDAKIYLRKFFDRKVTLPKVSLVDYLTAKELDFKKYETNNLTLCPFYEDQKNNIVLFSALFESNNIELRDVEQILNRFFAGLDYVVKNQSKSEVVLNTVVLMVGLLDHHLDKGEGEVIRSTNPNASISLEVSNGGFVTLGEFSVSTIINWMFKCVTKERSKNEYNGSGSRSEYPSEKEMLSFRAHVRSKVRLPFENQNPEVFFKKISGYSQNKDCKYLMWEEHQKIIELSGHIE